MQPKNRRLVTEEALEVAIAGVAESSDLAQYAKVVDVQSSVATLTADIVDGREATAAVAAQLEAQGESITGYIDTVAGQKVSRDEFNTAIDGKVGVGDARLFDARTPVAHGHPMSDVTGLSAALAGKVPNTDPRLSDSRTPVAHGHSIADVTGLQTALAGKVAADDARLSDARTPLTHIHNVADVSGLQTTLNGKAASVHQHVVGDVTGLASALAEKVNDSDPRLSDQRVPVAHEHALTEVQGASDAIVAASTAGRLVVVYTPGVGWPSLASEMAAHGWVSRPGPGRLEWDSTASADAVEPVEALDGDLWTRRALPGEGVGPAGPSNLTIGADAPVEVGRHLWVRVNSGGTFSLLVAEVS